MYDVAARVGMDAGNFVQGSKDIVKATGAVAAEMAAATAIGHKMADQMTKVGVGMIASGAGALLTARQYTKASGEVESSMRNVNSILLESEDRYNEMFDATVKLSTQLPQSAKENADALYDIASGGFDGAAGLKVLESSAVDAAAGVSTTSTASNALVAALNSYGLSAEHSKDVSDILFQTVKAGVITFEELALGMGSWVQLAASAKIPLDEAAAALAAMTTAGIRAEEAHTALARTIQAFIKPSDTMIDVVKKLGFASAETMLAEVGLEESIRLLQGTTGGSKEELAKLFQEVNGLNGVLALGAAGGAIYKDALSQIASESARAGSAQRAYQEQSKSQEAQQKKLGNTIRAIQIELGRKLLPMLTKGTAIATDFAGAFDMIPGPVKTVIAYGTVLSGVIMLLAGAVLATGLKGIVFTRFLGMVAPQSAAAAAGLRSMSAQMLATALHMKMGDKADKYIRMMQNIGEYAKVGAAALGGLVIGLSLASNIVSGSETAGLDKWNKVLEETGRIMGDVSGRAGEVEKFNRLNEEYIRILDEAPDGLQEKFQSFGQMLNPVDENSLQNSRAAALEFEKNLGEINKQIDNYDKNVQSISKATGLTTAEVEALARAMGVDLKRGFDIGTAILAEAYIKAGVELPEGLDNATSAFYRQWDAQKTGEITLSKLAEQYNSVTGEAGKMANAVIELTDYQKDLQKAFDDVGSAGTGFEDVLERKKKAADDFADNALEKIDEQKEGVKDQADREIKAIKDRESANKDLYKENEKGWEAYQKANDAAIDKIKERTEVETEELDKSKGAWKDYSEGVVMTLEDYMTGIVTQNFKLLSYQSNLVKLAENLGALQKEETITAEDAERVKSFIISQGAEGQELLGQMVAAGPEGMKEIVKQINANMQLMDVQTTIEIDAAMTVAQQAGAMGADATVEKILEHLNIGVDKMTDLGRKYGIAIVAGLVDATNGSGIKVVTESYDNDTAKGRAKDLGYKALGGQMVAGQSYIVGEQGPERVDLNAAGGGTVTTAARTRANGATMYDDIKHSMRKGNPEDQIVKRASYLKSYESNWTDPGFGTDEYWEELREKNSWVTAANYAIALDAQKKGHEWMFPGVPAGRSGGGQGGAQTWQKVSNFQFSGNMVMTDPAATARWAQARTAYANISGGT